MTDCVQVELYPTWFWSDLIQAVLFFLMMTCVLFKWSFFIQDSVKCKMYLFTICMILRPIIIYVTHILQEKSSDEHVTRKNKNIQLALLWADDLMFYVLFYYLIFIMKMIQINLKMKQEDTFENIEPISIARDSEILESRRTSKNNSKLSFVSDQNQRKT